jgi:hypothetical protein
VAVLLEVESKQPVIQELHSPAVEAVVQVFEISPERAHRLFLLRQQELVVRASLYFDIKSQFVRRLVQLRVALQL